jgi:hypothetical protein
MLTMTLAKDLIATGDNSSEEAEEEEVAIEAEDIGKMSHNIGSTLLPNMLTRCKILLLLAKKKRKMRKKTVVGEDATENGQKKEL